MERAQHLDGLLAASPSEFERVVATLLAASGYTDVVVVGGPGDLSADVTCRDSEGQLVIVQCKQYAPAQSIGSGAMQQFIGMGHVHHQADRMIYVTTAHYTQPAVDLAHKHGIQLVDGDALVVWAKTARNAGAPVEEGDAFSHTSLPVVSDARPLGSSGRWEQHSWRVCTECGTRTRWRDEAGQPLCQRCGVANP